MKKVIILMAILVSTLFACHNTETFQEHNLSIPVCSAIETERRGCCSWHGGVCGCENSRAVCCDGTYSPSCGCD